MPHRNIAIVGAGLAGLACARRLVQDGHAVRVFEKSRAAGGRMATRRGEEATWDHGAQYFTVSEAGFDTLVSGAREAGQVAAWTPRWPGGEQEQRELWVGVPGIAALPRWMAATLDLRVATRIVGLERRGTTWVLRDDAGGHHEAFDAVILALPAPQALALAGEHTGLASRLGAVEMAPCWALMVAFERRLEVPLDADWSPDPVLPWLARNSAKPRRSGLDAWVLHADADWSRRHLEADMATVRKALLARFAERIGSELPPVAVADAHRWRYARVTAPLGEACLFDPAEGLGLCGDWCLDARVEAAFESGDALGRRVTAWAREEP
jgi:predicted NAD/FAD-dependent oxidoreductase